MKIYTLQMFCAGLTAIFYTLGGTVDGSLGMILVLLGSIALGFFSFSIREEYMNYRLPEGVLLSDLSLWMRFKVWLHE